jgi:predicted Zn-dependent protease
MKSVVTFLLAVAIAAPASAQLPGRIGQIAKGVDKAKETVDELTFTDAEEMDLGAKISEMLRNNYGVVQDKAIHKYVTEVGLLLAAQSTRPTLKWTFVVLDTPGINAFAAPGGYIHITKGALAMLQNEAELAGVLGHEISHVTLKHTINAIKNEKRTDVALKGVGKMTGQQKVAQLSELFYKHVLENAYDRKDEMAADESGIALANKLGYAPGGLSDFLTRLNEHYKNQPDRSGLFASHPETQARLDAMKKQIAAGLSARALVQPRYGQAVAPMHLAAATPVAAGGGLGVSNLQGSGGQNSNNQSVSSAGSRGVNADRDAPGGPVKTAIVVTVTAAELADFKKGIVG